jgi:cobalt-zinc-cadmium efflux system membrane fusion protein
MQRDAEEVVEGRVRRGRPLHPIHQRLWQALIGLALFAVGLAAGVLWSGPHGAPRQTTSNATTPGTMPAMPGMPAKAAAPAGDEAIEVSLTPEAVERAGIKTAIVGTQATASGITVPGTVTTNAYRDTKVNSLVGGVVREVSADLGATVTRGQPLAVIFSTELADAQMKYVSVQAMFEADHQKLVRTEKLVALGAASRQELEDVTAAHAGHSTEVAAARQRLLLL